MALPIGQYDKVFYVNKSGLDTNDGLTDTTAFLTINKPFSILTETNKKVLVVVGGGTYTERIVNASTNNVIHLYGNTDSAYPGPSGTVLLTNATTNVITHDYIEEINNMTIQYSSTSTTITNGILYNVKNNNGSSNYKLTLNNCILDNGASSGISFFYGSHMRETIFNNCQFISTRTSGTFNIVHPGSATNPMVFKFNDCEFNPTAGVSMSLFTSSAPTSGAHYNIYMNNCHNFSINRFIAAANGMFPINSAIYLDNCEFYVNSIAIHDSTVMTGLYNNSYIKNSNIYYSGSTPITYSNLYKNRGANLSSSGGNFEVDTGWSSIDINMDEYFDIYNEKLLYVENLNSDGKEYLLSGQNSYYIELTDELYNNKPIILVQGTNITAHSYMPFKIKSVVGVEMQVVIPYAKIGAAPAPFKYKLLKGNQFIHNTSLIAIGSYTPVTDWQEATFTFTPDEDCNYYLLLSFEHSGTPCTFKFGQITTTTV